tara:strand:+ start:103 stop:555 length:453 start_codon:yes stop_codon:yes gene_type:complete
MYKLLKHDDLDKDIKRKCIKSIFNERSPDTLIVSNEGLLSGSFARMKPFCDAVLNKNIFDLVIISMFVRSPSSHTISSFHQWHFRNRQMFKEDISLSEKIRISWKALSPLERRLLTKVRIYEIVCSSADLFYLSDLLVLEQLFLLKLYLS